MCYILLAEHALIVNIDLIYKVYYYYSNRDTVHVGSGRQWITVMCVKL